jgi:LacI family transcriptional regulator
VNANTAIGALLALGKLGLSAPEDVSLVGYNDIPIVSRLPTPLTSVRVPFDQIAAAALDLLAAGPMGKHDRIRAAAPTLIPRRSTAATPTG